MQRLSEPTGLEYSFNHARQREIHAAGGLERQQPQRTVSEARESMEAAMRKVAPESDKWKRRGHPARCFVAKTPKLHANRH